VVKFEFAHAGTVLFNSLQNLGTDRSVMLFISNRILLDGKVVVPGYHNPGSRVGSQRVWCTLMASATTCDRVSKSTAYRQQHDTYLRPAMVTTKHHNLM
jgi:hypothetical protein